MQLPKALTRKPYDKAKCGGRGVVMKKHPKTFCDVATTSYRQMCALLKRRYGAEREREHSQNSFQLNQQEMNETAQDFLDRLMRAHKSGWPNLNAETREREVLNTLLHGLKDTQLTNTLDMEYPKPMHLIRPPRMKENRSYIQQLESSKELRRRKQEMAGAPRQVNQPLQDYLNPPTMSAATAPGMPQRRVRQCWKCNELGDFSWQCTKPAPPKPADDPQAPTVTRPIPLGTTIKNHDQYGYYMKNTSPAQKEDIINEVVQQRIDAEGLDDPIVCGYWIG